MRTVPSNDRASVCAEEGNLQLQRILHSFPFRNAPGSQKFLEYVVTKTLAGLAGELKEYSIAVEVLGKDSDYDPRLDTTVRVQAHRLREKIEEYYASEGCDDDILIELPKGHYIPQISRRSSPVSAGDRNAEMPTSQAGTRQNIIPAPADHAHLASPRREPRRIGISWLAAIAGALFLFIAGVLFAPWLHRVAVSPTHAQKPSSSATSTSNPVKAVWAGFWSNPAPTVAAYSNSMFLVTETSDLLRLKSGDVDGLGAPAQGSEVLKLAENPRLVKQAGPVFFNDGYTGTGEVMAVFDLERLFSESHHALTVERSQLITARDFENHNVIFLGSVNENPMLSSLPLTGNFTFAQPLHPPILWRSRIVNRHPLPGEKPFYQVEHDPSTQVLDADYALVSFLPGVAPGHEIVVLGGLMTIGTQAAAQFVTSPQGASQIIEHLGAKDPGGSAIHLPRYFQALLKVDIQKDEILKISYVTGRRIQPAR